MDPCVYTTQHRRWLLAAVGDWPTPVCFRSGKRWKKAHHLLTPPATLRVLFREQDETETTPGLACRFVADLVEILFVADHLATDRARRAELQERLWLQRDTMIKSKSQDWDIKRETDTFLKAVTWFSVRNVLEIDPLPLPRLRLLEDNRPLSSEYRRGYALCRYPKNEIKPIVKT